MFVCTPATRGPSPTVILTFRFLIAVLNSSSEVSVILLLVPSVRCPEGIKLQSSARKREVYYDDNTGRKPA